MALACLVSLVWLAWATFAGSVGAVAVAEAAAPLKPSRPRAPAVQSTGLQPVPASNTQIEGSNGGGVELRAWGPEILVDFDDAAPRQFRVQTSSTKAKKFRWEVIPQGFAGITPIGGTATAVDTGTEPVRGNAGQWQIFTIDFSKLAPKKPAAISTEKTVRLPGAPAAKKGKQGLRKAKANLKRIQKLPRVYAVRAVALDASGRPLGLASTPVRVVHGPKEIIEPAELAGEFAESPPKGSGGGVTVTVRDYETVKFAHADRATRWVITGPNAWNWPIGHQFVWDPNKEKDKGLLEEIGDTIVAAAEFMVDAVNWASQAYADIKAFALEVAVKLVPGCKELPACKEVLSTALDYGLAAVGLPPSLPDFDMLVDMGEGYLTEVIAQELATEFPGGSLVAEEAARALVTETRRRLEEAANHGPGGNRWCKPDPAYQPHNAYVVLEVKNTSDRPLAGALTLRVSRIFNTMYIPLPPVAPGKTMTIPVSLEPNIAYYEAQYLRAHKGNATGQSHYQQMWLETYNRDTAVFEISGTASTEFRQKANKSYHKVVRLPRL